MTVVMMIIRLFNRFLINPPYSFDLLSHVIKQAQILFDLMPLDIVEMFLQTEFVYVAFNVVVNLFGNVVNQVLL